MTRLNRKISHIQEISKKNSHPLKTFKFSLLENVPLYCHHLSDSDLMLHSLAIARNFVFHQPFTLYLYRKMKFASHGMKIFKDSLKLFFPWMYSYETLLHKNFYFWFLMVLKYRLTALKLFLFLQEPKKIMYRPLHRNILDIYAAQE